MSQSYEILKQKIKNTEKFSREKKNEKKVKIPSPSKKWSFFKFKFQRYEYKIKCFDKRLAICIFNNLLKNNKMKQTNMTKQSIPKKTLGSEGKQQPALKK